MHTAPILNIQSYPQNPTSAIQSQYRRYADVQKSPKLPLMERRAFPLPAAGRAPREMQDIGG